MKNRNGQKNILVVDDQASIRKMMCEMITRKFNTVYVESVSSGEEAIEKLKIREYNLVFLDINLGEKHISGIEVLKQIKEIKPEQNVCIMTGYSVEEEENEIIKDNAVDILYKPFKLEKLFEVIEKYVIV